MPASALHAGERAAQDAREAFGIKADALIADIVELIEGVGVPVFLAPLPGRIAGLASRMNGRWYIVGDSSSPVSGRLRFTLAHELGHVWMRHAPAVDDDSTLFGRVGHPQEVAANYFAAELLLPRAVVEDRFATVAADELYTATAELARAAGTTLWVPFYRLKTLDLLARSEEEALRAQVADGAVDAAANDIVERIAGSSSVRMPAGYEEDRRGVAHLLPNLAEDA
jgi:Zn-dependent peptidase ImmA (M78 family)